MAQKIITAYFTTAGVPVIGLSPTIDIWELDPNNPLVNPQVVTNGPLTPIGDGWYRYTFTTYDYSKSYVYTIDGGNTLADCERYKIGGNESYEEDISFQVWEEPNLDHLNLGTTGYVLNQIKADTSSIIINVNTAISLIQTLLKYERNRTRIDPIAKTLTIYDDDCVTPLQVFDLLDAAGQPSVTEVCERKPTTCP